MHESSSDPEESSQWDLGESYPSEEETVIIVDEAPSCSSSSDEDNSFTSDHVSSPSLDQTSSINSELSTVSINHSSTSSVKARGSTPPTGTSGTSNPSQSFSKCSIDADLIHSRLATSPKEGNNHPKKPSERTVSKVSNANSQETTPRTRARARLRRGPIPLKPKPTPQRADPVARLASCALEFATLPQIPKRKRSDTQIPDLTCTPTPPRYPTAPSLRPPPRAGRGPIPWALRGRKHARLHLHASHDVGAEARAFLGALGASRIYDPRRFALRIEREVERRGRVRDLVRVKGGLGREIREVEDVCQEVGELRVDVERALRRRGIGLEMDVEGRRGFVFA